MNKKMFLALAAIISLLCLNACGPQPKQISINDILRGEHQLRKIGQLVGSETKTKQNFFLIAYSQTETKNTVVLIKFSWKMNDGTYASSSLPMEKIRVKLVKNISTPTIKFRWNTCDCSNKNITQEIMDMNVLYALITINETDWPTDINVKKTNCFKPKNYSTE